MRRLTVIAACALALVGAACGASESADDPEDPEATAPAQASGDAAFGDLGELCGDGDFTVAADEAGRGTDALYIAVANDRGAQIRPGLNKVLYDASVAFASSPFGASPSPMRE